jgi:hypothetical protein
MSRAPCSVQDKEDTMGFLPKKWLRKLWGVDETPATFAPPIDCDDCRAARAAGRDACAVHGVKHPAPHTYNMGHEVEWGSPLSGTLNDTYPRRESESISD